MSRRDLRRCYREGRAALNAALTIGAFSRFGQRCRETPSKSG